ncbi:MAG: DUF177 domain-containing protein [Candidatus Omnitrophica bacterium]|nr:DUF177 domain-containing protein [Candidatus Omnitrophota bacterium]
MKIDVIKLRENTIENFQESLTPLDLDLDTNEVKYKGNINISTDVKKEMQLLSTKTHFSATAEFTCSRCLKEFDNVIEKDFDIKYPLEKTEQFIDITQDIRQEVILGYPVKFLCKPDCRGLCPTCGQDLNNEDCGCQMKTQLTE